MSGQALGGAAMGLPVAFAGGGPAAAVLPTAFAQPAQAAAAASGLPGSCAVQTAGGTGLASAAAVPATWPGMSGPDPGLAAAYAQIADGSAMYAQHLEYGRFVAALTMQHAAASSSASTAAAAAAPQLSASVASASRGGPWMGLKNHDPERRYQGVVCRWDEQAGFGFINDLESHRVYGRDVFLHAAQIDRESDNYKRRRKIDITNGDKVMYVVEMDRGKPRAKDVEVIERCGKRDDRRDDPEPEEPERRRRRE